MAGTPYGSFTPVPPPVDARPVPTAPYAPQAPKKTSPVAIASLVCGIAAYVVWTVPRFGFFASAACAILAIVLGSVGIAQTGARGSYKGRGMAVGGLTLGIVAVALAVIAIVFIVLLFAAAFSAIMAACGGGAKMAPLAMAANARDRWAHHPDCEHYANDVLRVAGQRFCLGCVVTASMATVAFGAAMWGDLAWSWASASGLLLGSAQFLSILGRTKELLPKVLVKTSLGLGIGLTLAGILVAPWPPTARIFAVIAGYGLAYVIMRPRRRRVDTHACADVPTRRPISGP